MHRQTVTRAKATRVGAGAPSLQYRASGRGREATCRPLSPRGSPGSVSRSTSGRSGGAERAAGVTDRFTSGYSLTRPTSRQDAFMARTGGEVSGRIVGARAHRPPPLASPEAGLRTGSTLRFHFANEQARDSGSSCPSMSRSRALRHLRAAVVGWCGGTAAFTFGRSRRTTTLASPRCRPERGRGLIFIVRGLEVGDRYLARNHRNEREA